MTMPPDYESSADRPLTASWSGRKLAAFALFVVVVGSAMANAAPPYVVRALDARLAQSEAKHPRLIS